MNRYNRLLRSICVRASDLSVDQGRLDDSKYHICRSDMLCTIAVHYDEHVACIAKRQNLELLHGWSRSSRTAVTQHNRSSSYDPQQGLSSNSCSRALIHDIWSQMGISRGERPDVQWLADATVASCIHLP